jgi:outer membrane receptor protein involved in Fe transport
VRSKSSATLNARLAYRFSNRVTLAVEAFNLTDAEVSDVDYFYSSRLPGEPADGVNDIHTHPLENRSIRLGVSTTF